MTTKAARVVTGVRCPRCGVDMLGPDEHLPGCVLHPQRARPRQEATVPLSLYLDLLAKYDALKRDGFVAEPVAAPTEDVPGFPTLIEDAVAQRAVDSASRRTLEQFARTQLKKGESPQDVATAILAGEDLEDG